VNLLFIHEVSFLNNVTYEWQQWPALLAERGHDVYIIDYESKWHKERPFDLISKYQEVNFARPHQKSSVELIHPSFIKVPVLSRASAWATHWEAIERTIRDKQIDVIILYSVPTNGLQTVRIAKKYGVPIVFRSIDTLNQLVHNKLLSRITRIMEREVYSKADLILTICPALSRYVTDMGADKDRVKVLPLGVDTEVFKPNIDTSYWRDLYQLFEVSKIVIFVGTLPRFCGLGKFIHSFPNIVKEVPEAMLVIVGDGEQATDLSRMVADCGLDDYVVMTGYQSFENIPELINLASVCINPFPICGATKDIFPTKVIQYLACGKPVVSTPLPGLVDMVREEINGIVYTDKWVETIVKLLKSDGRRESLGKSGLEYVKRVHDYGKIVDQLELELEKVLN